MGIEKIRKNVSKKAPQEDNNERLRNTVLEKQYPPNNILFKILQI